MLAINNNDPIAFVRRRLMIFASLPILRRPVSVSDGFLLADISSIFSVAIPAFALVVIDTGIKIQPDYYVVGALCMGIIFIVKSCSTRSIAR